MALLLGVDTGGTYTDAVLLRDGEQVLASAKALTTRDDLARGIGAAVENVLTGSGASAGDVAMASLSTTLATNALVEGNGGAAALVVIGFSDGDLARQGLDAALGKEPLIAVAGGHNHAGGEAAPLDEQALRAALQTLPRETSAVAVAAHFATRNPAHEDTARTIIREETGLPVTCSHELSSKLGGPKRALTALLNARLIGMIDRLIASCETRLRALSIDAPLMVVRGDGALVSAAFARERPIETILSGPAASIVGARWLTGAQDALVSDIGGTTTDVCLLQDGRPRIDPGGAFVGGFRTMVEAVAMRTTGLGGDSEVHMQSDGLQGVVTLGPRRVMPVSLAAATWPDVVLPALEAAHGRSVRGDHDGRFVAPTGAGSVAEGKEQALLDRIGKGCKPLTDVVRNRVDLGTLRRMAARGAVMFVGITPSDAAHALGLLDAWDGQAAALALEVFARQRTGNGQPLADGADAMARMIVAALHDQTTHCLLSAGFEEDMPDQDADRLARHVLTQAGLTHHRGVIRADLGLGVPVIGLGASAPTWYGPVGERLGTPMLLPEHAGVANAIGAVAGQVSVRETGSVTCPSDGLFRVHLPDAAPLDFADEAAALSALEAHLTALARTAANAAGADGLEVGVERDFATSVVENRRVLVSAEITVTASGRPAIAVG